jgi:molybdopterin-containing oxidoreductase family membrane subunit
MFSPTFVDIGIFIGTIGFFFVLFLLYSRTFPVIAQAEVKSILKSSGSKYKTLRDSGQPLYNIQNSASSEVTAEAPEDDSNSENENN